MRILIISQYFYPDITAAAFRIYDTVKLLAEKGHEICVITAHPHKAQAKTSDEPDFNEIIIRRSKVMGIGSGGLINYLKHYFSFMLGSIWQGMKQRFIGWKPDVIWASSPPLFVGLSGRILSVVCGCPLVLDIRDIWPDSAVAAGQISQNGLAYRIGKKMEKYLYKNANHITCVSCPMKQYIASKTNVPVSVIYNGVLGQSDDIMVQQTVKTPDFTERHKVILYAGNLGRVQQLDLLIIAYSELLKEGYLKDWVIRFIGGGVMVDDLRSLIENLQLQERVFIDPPVTREIVMQKLRTANLLFISLLPAEVLKMTIPSKVFDYMLAGRPIVAGVFGEGKDILESTGANVCYNTGDLDDLKQALKNSIAKYTELELLAYKNKLLVLSQYNRSTGVSALLSIFDSLLLAKN